MNNGDRRHAARDRSSLHTATSMRYGDGPQTHIKINGITTGVTYKHLDMHNLKTHIPCHDDHLMTFVKPNCTGNVPNLTSFDTSITAPSRKHTYFIVALQRHPLRIVTPTIIHAIVRVLLKIGVQSGALAQIFALEGFSQWLSSIIVERHTNTCHMTSITNT